jgi:hypothetical protein
MANIADKPAREKDHEQLTEVVRKLSEDMKEGFLNLSNRLTRLETIVHALAWGLAFFVALIGALATLFSVLPKE